MKLLELQSTHDPLSQPLLLATDSSISLGGRPIFLPEISQRWLMQISPAFRISRLGKTISERFASRYYDAFTLAARLLPLDLMDTLEKSGMRHSPFATAFDGAVSLGAWIPADYLRNGAAGLPAALAVNIGASETEAGLTANLTESADKAIALLSRNFILKNGDVIVTGGPLTESEVMLDTHVEVSSGQHRILSFNIK